MDDLKTNGLQPQLTSVRRHKNSFIEKHAPIPQSKVSKTHLLYWHKNKKEKKLNAEGYCLGFK